MSTTQTLAKNSLASGQNFSGSLAPADYLWKNMAIEKSASESFVYRMYKGSLLEVVWLLFTSPLH